MLARVTRLLFYAVFVLVGSALIALTHRYLWKRFVRDTELTGWSRRGVTAFIWAGALLVPLGLAVSRRLPHWASEGLSILVFVWAGSVLYLVLALATVDTGRFGWTWLKKRRAKPAPPEPVAAEEDPPAPIDDPGRRIFLARAAAGTALLGSAGLITIGLRNALGELTEPELSVRLPRLPKALDGLRVVQISDVHIHPILDGRFLASVVEKINARSPDVVVITGDLVDGTVALIGPQLAPLGKIRARYGTYFVTGNHEYYSGADEWCRYLAKLNVRVLTNERVSIGDSGPGGASFDLAGIPDVRAGMFYEEHTPDLAKALAGRDLERELVLLAHRPNPIVDAAEHGVGLQLSGHTHGGQFWPITTASEFIHPYSAGLHRHNDLTQIYVSRGTGFWGPPVRILAPAEITTLILRT